MTAALPLRYRAIGPAVSGGRITAVTGSDVDPSRYYAGGADGGVFKSTDGGVTWSPIFDFAPVAAIGALALNRANPDDIWVGTGESNPRNTVEAGDGIWHSRDGGRSWTHLGLDGTYAISSIVIDPNDANDIVVGALGNPFAPTQDRGAYRTTDGGKHWQRTLFVAQDAGVSDIASDPANPRRLLAGVWEFQRTPWSASAGGYRGGIFASDDGGATWRQLRGGGLPTGPTGRIGLAISRSNPRRIYAEIQSREGAIWRSDDGGKTWKSFAKSTWVGYRGYYFSKIFVDPADQNHVLDLATLTSRSENGGASFSPVFNLNQYDDHALWWSKDGRRIIHGADTGVGISVDGGKNWFTPRDLPVSQVYHIGVNATFPYQVCVGLQDVNSWCGPAVAENSAGILNANWKYIAPGDGNYSVCDPVDPNLVWSTETNRSAGQVYITDLRTRASAEISPSQRFSEGLPAKNLPFRFDWMTPIAFTFTNPVRTLTAGNVVFETTDRGQHWTAISPDLTRNEKSHQGLSGGIISHDNTGAEFTDAITSVATTPLDPQLIWAAADEGMVHISRNLGATWTDVTPKQVPPWGRINVLEPSHADAGTAYIAVDRHTSGDARPYVLKTEDYGKRWTSIAGDLPRNLFLRCVREDPGTPKLLFVCTQRGVWASFDGGTHWQSLRLNMPASAIYDIEFFAPTHDLLAGTQGRGVYVLDDISPLELRAQGKIHASGLLPVRDAYRYFLQEAFSSRAAGDFFGENAPYGAVLNVYAERPLRQATIQIRDGAGALMRTLGVNSLRAGLNRIVWDLHTDGPVMWKQTPDAGPSEGPQVVPGSYTVQLRAQGIDSRQTLEVRAVSPDPALLAQYRARYRFLRGLFDDLSRINARLNVIGDTPERNALTSDYRSPLQMVMETPRLRERVMALIERVRSSDQAPTQSQLNEAQTLHRSIEQTLGAQ